LGSELGNFKTFTQGLPPDDIGYTIGSSELIRTVHNSFARPEPFIYDDKKDEGEEEDAFHFIGFVPVNGNLYELDGLKPGPILLGECDMNNWLSKVKPVIEERIKRYSEKEIRFNLLGLIQNRQDVLTKELGALQSRTVKLEAEISKRNASQASAAMDTSESEPSSFSSSSEEELKQMLSLVEEEQKQTQQQIIQEQNKFKAWKNENVRRRHNYIPFIFNLLKILAEKGKLNDLVEKASKVTAEKNAKKKQQKQASPSISTSASSTLTAKPTKKQ